MKRDYAAMERALRRSPLCCLGLEIPLRTAGKDGVPLV